MKTPKKIFAATLILGIMILAAACGAPNAANDNIDALHAQIKSLQEENAALRGSVDDGSLQAQIGEYQEQIRQLQETIVAMSDNAEYWESNAQDADNLKNKQIDALNLLVQAQQAYINQDADTVNSLITEIQSGAYEFLESDALYAYYMILEYMEQPYFGN